MPKNKRKESVNLWHTAWLSLAWLSLAVWHAAPGATVQPIVLDDQRF